MNSAPTAGQIVDEGYNVADDTTCGFSGTSHQGSSDQAIGLGPLTENGGPTPTMQVTSSSAAYDIVPTDKQLSGDDIDFCSRYDERGIPRAQTGASACSAGAYQFAPPTLSLVVPSSDEAGQAVTIAGSNLQYARVTFGSGDAPGTVASPSPTGLTATVPILSPGSQPITVTNADGSAQLPFTLLPNPQVTTASLPNAEVGVPYVGQLNASGGVTPLTWTASSALPAGLTLSANGVIAGTPTAAGGPFDVAVSDINGVTATQSLQITVVPAVVIATSSLRSAVAGVPYGADLHVGAGTGEGPYEWSIVDGSLPVGLGLARDGEISGVPTLAGRATVVLKVTDALGGSVQVSLNLTVTPGASPAPELTHLRQTHKVFAVGSGATTLSARAGGRGKPVKKTAVGTVFSFTLSQAA
ncbi:MAG: choice-of-anchor Q domain-containing protein, partial [Trebonia sp.]